MTKAAAGRQSEQASLFAAAKEELLSGVPSGACHQIDALTAAEPNNAPALHLKGIIEARNGAFAEASLWFERALTICPSKTKWNNDLGCSRGALGEWKGAAGCFEKVLKQFPDDFAALTGCGRALLELGDEAAALEKLRSALVIRPDSLPVRLSLARTLAAAGEFAAAVDVLQSSVDAHPGRAEPKAAIAGIYHKCREFELARSWWRSVLDLVPEDPHANTGLIFSCWHLGDLTAALEIIERLIKQERATQELHLFWLATRLHEYGLTAKSIRQGCEAFGREITPASGKSFEAKRPSSAASRPLRIGYVGGEFMAGSPHYFFPPLLENHDRRNFEIFLYHSRKKYDEVTDLFSRMGHWRDCRELNDEDLIRLIDQDSIDILVDISGFFPGNKLPVFAGRAAPIQIAYPQCPVTTGIPAMDYIFTDRWTCPPGQEAQYTEQPVFVPSGYIGFTPAADAPDITGLPAERNGFVTFGIFQRRLKMNSAVWDVISSVLQRCPGSRLIIQHHDRTLEDADSQNRRLLIDEFTSRGVAEERLSLLGERSHRETLSAMAQSDIALDTFPYQGQTTTCECLWQGVPVIALAGDIHVARVGSAILERVGLGHLSNPCPEDYVRCAVDLAHDLSALAQLRAKMRERLLCSSLLNGRNLAREVEAAYRLLWQAWCEGDTRVDLEVWPHS